MKKSDFPENSGIYQMLNADGKILYVGKARNLKKRINSYFREQGLSPKTAALMRQVDDIHIIITASDTEALLLEATLIKEYRPRYNILLRDDKSYPYLYISTDDDYPRLDFYRGTRQTSGRYFGPYPSAGAVRDNLALLQKLFQLRQCQDSFFNHRSRPCLQYQIKRCTAPCVGFISPENYAQQVRHTILFLEGKNDQVISALQEQMDLASSSRHYELAAQYRDQIVQLRKLQETQCVSGKEGDFDIVAVALAEHQAAITVMFVRQGRVIGQSTYFPALGIAETIPEILHVFIPHYYLYARRADSSIEKIILSDSFKEKQTIEQLLQEQLGRKISITDFRGALYKQWQTMAKMNAQHALQEHCSENASIHKKLQTLQEVLNLEEPIERIECFDVSHTQGEATVASCVVYGKEGASHKEYRRYNIKDIEKGDDYAAMRQVLMRRYQKLKMEGSILPDVVLIDGGKGQLKKAIEVFEELQLTTVQLVAISKGPSRKAGQEQIWLTNQSHALHLKEDSMALHVMQFIRDEAHRFAITHHRTKRSKVRNHSRLEDIPGIGPKRRTLLLRHFGGLQKLKTASIIELEKVSGISRGMAELIFKVFHDTSE